MADTEKVSFNMSVVDLGQLDLLIEQGFYSSRTDFVITAVRNLLLTHAPTVQQTVARHLMALGVVIYNRKILEKARAAGKRHEIKVVGVVTLAHDITPELARATIKSIKVFGVLRASPELKTALKDRIE